MTHELKIEPKWFEDVISGKKEFEIRWDDRCFKVGDELLLKEFDVKRKSAERYTGREVSRTIKYIHSDGFGMMNGYVVLGLDRPTGHWVYAEHGIDWNIPAWRCSECGGRNKLIPTHIDYPSGETMRIENPYVFAGSQFCPHCGIKMVKGEE